VIAVDGTVQHGPRVAVNASNPEIFVDLVQTLSRSSKIREFGVRRSEMWPDVSATCSLLRELLNEWIHVRCLPPMTVFQDSQTVFMTLLNPLPLPCGMIKRSKFCFGRRRNVSMRAASAGCCGGKCHSGRAFRARPACGSYEGMWRTAGYSTSVLLFPERRREQMYPILRVIADVPHVSSPTSMMSLRLRNSIGYIDNTNRFLRVRAAYSS
jgi:hypothetical protein